MTRREVRVDSVKGALVRLYSLGDPTIGLSVRHERTFSIEAGFDEGRIED